THAKADALLHIANGIKARREEFAETMVAETAKPITYARAEVDRAILTFIDGAEECKRIYGEWMPLDRHPSGNNHEAIIRRFPVGLVAAIAPFNFPLNLVAHKLAPAIAAGCPIILKPASKTPISALLLAELIDETQLPKGAVSILPMDRETGDMMVTDDRFKLLTFTGSPVIGWDMKARAGKKKTVLELGGNAAAIITESTNFETALAKCVTGAFSFSGQSCIHTQRIYIHEKHFDKFTSRFVEETKKLVYGDPMDEKTQISSMIDAKNAERIDVWVKEAVSQDATVLCGGSFANSLSSARKGRVAAHVPLYAEGRVGESSGRTGFLPTILTNTNAEMTICAEEAFAPVVILEKYSKFSDALASVNNSKFGLQAGVFTDSMHEVMTAYDVLDVGGVIINNVPTFRADHMPYGGVKDSGIGREGVRYVIEDMTELKVLVINKI
ncbi:MAG: aldehyde dehydrogenase family protein, partial [Patescibacteria group bacterium]